MILAVSQGLPLGVSVHSANPGEIQLAPETLALLKVGRNGPGRTRQYPDRLIADRGYDSYAFRRWLAARASKTNRPSPVDPQDRALGRQTPP